MLSNRKPGFFGVFTDEDVLAAAAREKVNFVQDYFDMDMNEYDRYLYYYYTSDYGINKMYQHWAIQDMLSAQLVQPGNICGVTADEVGERYMKTSHIFIGESEYISNTQAYSKAVEAIARLDSGEDLKRIIQLYGTDPAMEKQDFYIIKEGDMLNEFYQAAKALSPGEYTSEPVKTDAGWIVIYRHPLTEADEGYYSAAYAIARDKYAVLMDEWVRELEFFVDYQTLDEALEYQHD